MLFISTFGSPVASRLNERLPNIDIYTPSTQEGTTLPLYFNISSNLLFRTYIAPFFIYFLSKANLSCNFIQQQT